MNYDSRRNDYLMRRNRDMRSGRQGDRARGGRGSRQGDRRNPYGSQGGYVRSDRNRNSYDGIASEHNIRKIREKNLEMHNGKRMNDNARRYDRRMHEDYDDDEEEDYNNNQYDYNDYDYAMEDEYNEEQYMKDLKKWIKKLKGKDKFELPKQEVLKKAEEMKIEFEEYSEEEFYAIYLMLVSDYPNIADNPHTYIVMAKQFLEDDDVNVSPSEKVCKYLYEIVLNEEQE